MRDRQRAWLRVHDGSGALWTNGIFTLGDRLDGEAVAALWETIEARVASSCRVERKPLRHVGQAPPGAELGALAVMSTAVIALDDVSTLARERPKLLGRGSKVRGLESAIAKPVSRYRAALGANAKVVDEWREHTRVYLEKIQLFERFWKRFARPAAADAAGTALESLLSPLALLDSFEHDVQMHADQERRLAHIGARTESATRDAAEFVGLFGILAAIIQGKLAAYATGGLVLLYLGWRAAYLALRVRLRELRLSWRRRSAGHVEPGPRALADAIQAVADGPSAVVTGKNIALVDYAWAVLIWLELLEIAPAARSPVISCDLADARDRATVVIGGPLTVSGREAFSEFVCELAPPTAIYDDWAYFADGDPEPKVKREDDDGAGAVSVSKEHQNVIAADGFTSVGVDIAAQFVRDQLRLPPPERERAAWTILSYDELLGRAELVARG